MRFPGERCDPFIDWCITGYDCSKTSDGTEHFFECVEFVDQWSQGADGMLGSVCSSSSTTPITCNTGMTCVGETLMPAGVCDPMLGTSCCTQLCRFDDTDCPTGLSCEIFWWMDDLADYLDGHIGIGMCVAP